MARLNETLILKVKVDLSLWSAILLRISGVNNPWKHNKITIDELIAKDRPSKPGYYRPRSERQLLSCYKNKRGE